MCENNMDAMKEQFGFLNRVNPALLTLYPLQLANMERLEKNDAVFIFDEVGCGKTISSGLMALSYLEANPDKNVLVITINSLVKTGQFLNDWFQRLPFSEEQKKHIRVINDHVVRIEKAKRENWGLIIVDEAQLFLADDETGKGQALERLNSDKLVFLTATPIRKDEKDIEAYIRLADSILKKETVTVAGETCAKEFWREKIHKELADAMQGKEEIAENICAKFDTTLPVTRYFKDTVRFLEKATEDGEIAPKKGAKRRFSQIWRVGEEIAEHTKSKEECLFLNIQNCLEKNKNHHFVVFATKKQAEDLGRYFQERGFYDYYSGNWKEGDKTYRVITGANSEELGNFGKKSTGNPTVLFVNYQIAEQGLNLPEFDYAINFQISRFPSRLEQRFGRIDRLGENDKENINICYILNDTLFDTSTWNFYLAMDAYLESILPFLPSRNMILSDKILSELSDVSQKTKRRLETILDKLEKGDALSEEEKEILAPKRNQLEEDEEEDDAFFYVSKDGTAIETIKNWIRQIEKMQSNQAQKVEYARKAGIIKETDFSDEIFVKYGTDKKMITLTNTDCARTIAQREEYKRYCSFISSFSEIYKEKELHEKAVSHAINSYLVMAFALGDLHAIYPLDGYRRQMKRILQIQPRQYLNMAVQICQDKDVPAGVDNSRRIRFQYAVRVFRYSMDRWGESENKMGWEPVTNLTDADREFLLTHAERFLLKLPIYAYLNEVGKALFIREWKMCDNGNFHTGWYSENYEKWCDCFCETFPHRPDAYWRYYTEGEHGWEPSPFLKLFYHFERCESPILHAQEGTDSIYGLHYRREQEGRALLENFLDYIETDDSQKKESIKENVKERLQSMNGLNQAVREWCCRKGSDRSRTSLYGQIFHALEGGKKRNWKIKTGYWHEDEKVSHIESIVWYAGNHNPFREALLGELLRKATIRKKPDYWSYNLIKEMLGDYRFYYNSEIEKIYRDSDLEYGFDFASIGITDAILNGPDKELANQVLGAIMPWIKGF